jgi:hypothetical protein
MMNYNFKEILVLSVDPNHDNTPKKTKVDIVAFTNSSVDLYQAQDVKGEGSSSFPLLVKDVLLQYNLQRLVIQSASESIASSSTVTKHVEYGELLNAPLSIGTPIGTSIFARFVLPPDEKNATKQFEEEELVLHNTKFIFLLRTLNTYNLLSCGATPLSSVTTSSILQQLQHTSMSSSQRFHHLQFPNPMRRSNALPRTLDYHIILPSSNDVGTFICHDNYQAFVALSSPCYSKSTAVGILGTSGITSDVLHASPRKHLWIDASSTTSCFEDRKHDASITSSPCTLSLSQGISYTKYMNLERQQLGKSGEIPISVSLNQLLLVEQGRQKKKKLREKQQLKPCPFATSSDIFTVIGSSFSLPSFLQYDPNEMKVFSGNETRPVISSQSKHSLFGLLPKPHNKSNNKDGTGSSSSLIDLDAAWVTFNSSSSSNIKSCTHCTGITSKPSWGIERIHKYLSDSGSSTGSIGVGQLQTCIFNGDDSFPAHVSLTDYFPNTIIYPLLHTTEIWLHRGACAGDFATFPLCQDDDASNVLVKPTYNSTKLNLASHSSDYVLDYQFVTSPRSGATLELIVQLPPDSSLCVSMEYNHRFLPFDFFPSDPNRGINIPPSFAHFSCPTCTAASQSTTLFTSSLLLLPPSPDMTMPFNVISLTTTIYAFIVGSVMNILIRRSSASINKALGKVEADVKSKIKIILTNIKEKVMRSLPRNRKHKVKDE